MPALVARTAAELPHIVSAHLSEIPCALPNLTDSCLPAVVARFWRRTRRKPTPRREGRARHGEQQPVHVLGRRPLLGEDSRAPRTRSDGSGVSLVYRSRPRSQVSSRTARWGPGGSNRHRSQLNLSLMRDGVSPRPRPRTRSFSTSAAAASLGSTHARMATGPTASAAHVQASPFPAGGFYPPAAPGQPWYHWGNP